MISQGIKDQMENIGAISPNNNKVVTIFRSLKSSREVKRKE